MYYLFVLFLVVVFFQHLSKFIGLVRLEELWVCTLFSISVRANFLSVKVIIISYLSILAFVLGAQKNRLIKTVLLSIHNIGFGCEIRKFFFVRTPIDLTIFAT